MKSLLLFPFHRPRKPFLTNSQAVLGLPMRLTVALVIGAVALSAILGFILQPCLFPGRMVVSVEPMVYNIATHANPFTVNVTVQDSNGRGIAHANIIITGPDVAASNTTDVEGKASLSVDPVLDSGYEGYLDVRVKAPCFETFDQSDMIMILYVQSS